MNPILKGTECVNYKENKLVEYILYICSSVK